MLNFGWRYCCFALSFVFLGAVACDEPEPAKDGDSGAKDECTANGGNGGAQDGQSSCYPAGSCLSNGNLVLPDETISAADGCNTCTCSSGELTCTSKPCGTGCFAPDPDDDLDCRDGEKVEAYRYNVTLGSCNQRDVVRCDEDLPDGYFSTMKECEAACPDDEAVGCFIDGELYPHGSDSGFKDPFSCNSCTCFNGIPGDCSQGACPKPCPEGTGPGSQCGVCGQDGRCEAIEIACLPYCGEEGDAPCASGGCINGLCVTACE